jgi:c-di-GMP phosphodiesterase
MSSNLKDVLFARQPIFDRENQLYGFELLYRGVDQTQALFDDGNKATCELLVNYCSGILGDDNAPQVKIFINLTDDLLNSDYFFPLDPERLVIEILEDVVVNQAFVERIQYLKQKGYTFALDDYTFEPRFDPILPLVEYIKVELLTLSNEVISEKFNSLKQRLSETGLPLPLLLAEKVEDRSQYEHCLALGFDLFQGYYLEKPQLVYGKKISNNSESAMLIVTKLQDSQINIDSLCHNISRDTKLSYQLLKIINSPLCRLPRKVSSLKEAVVFLGLEQVKKWSMALAMSGNSKQPPELFRILLTRARTCELYATQLNLAKPESHFTVGLLSGIDAVMMADKEWLLENIELETEMNQAILNYEGEKGHVLKMVLALEHAEWSTTSQLSEQEQITLFKAHESAVNWAHQMCFML